MHWPLALVQLFFTLAWTVYVIFLPGLLARAGIEAAWLPWILIADQLLFAVADVAVGLWLDRNERFLQMAGDWLAGLVLAACALFALLPFLAGAMPAGLFVSALFAWVICSSVLRVPPLVMLARYATPQQPASLASPVAAYLFGLGVAGALAPYLTVWLKNRDPLLPFIIASVSLAVTTQALRGALNTRAASAAPAARTRAPARMTIGVPLLVGVALFAFGMQIHAAANSAKLFARVAPAVPLDWLMPLFWAGFSVAMFPASWWLARRAARPQAMAAAALWPAGMAGGIALMICATAPALPLLVALQIIAGGAWAVVFLAALAAAAEQGRGGREGGWIGATLALLALATVGRIVLVLAAAPGTPLAGQLPWLSGILWLSGAALLWRASAGRTGK
ncbi:MAG: hypothetical protein ABI790_13655 [Betaproteobacteria bacterium]